MRNLLDAMVIAALLCAISLGTTVLQERRYQKTIIRDGDNGCLYLGTPAGGYTVMRNTDGSLQCEEGRS